jgi:ParB/RepB/Spo0J family partition protein
MNVIKIHIDQIRVGARLRSLRAERVAELAESIAQQGLRHPITVAPHVPSAEGGSDPACYDLVAGLHRLEAYKLLSHEGIEAVVEPMTDTERRLWEIDENLCRAELNELERGEHLVERKRLYEAEHPETKQHVAGGHARQGAASANLSFAGDTESLTGIDERTIQRSIRRATTIDPKVRDRIRDNPKIANSGVELDALASLPAHQQKHIVDLINAGEATSVRDAKTTLGAKAKSTPPAAWSKRRDKVIEAFINHLHRQPSEVFERLRRSLGRDHIRIIEAIPAAERVAVARYFLGLNDPAGSGGSLATSEPVTATAEVNSTIAKADVEANEVPVVNPDLRHRRRLKT